MTVIIEKSKKHRKSNWALMRFISKISLGKFKIPQEVLANRYRMYAARYHRMVSDSVASKLNYTVAYGPFKGMKIDSQPYWAPSDLGIKCFGMYELEIQDLLIKLQKERHRSTFIDLGGADGYFAIGVLVNRLFDKCIVYEMDAKGREKLGHNSSVNGVRDRIIIKGEANIDTLSEALANNQEDFILLCDIEGAEYSLFTEDLLFRLRNNHLIIEMHEPYYYGQEKADQLFERAIKHFKVDIILSGGRDFSLIEEAHLLSDIERALLMSEGRGPIGTWWHLSPL